MENFHRQHIDNKLLKSQDVQAMIHIHRFCILTFSQTMPQNHVIVPQLGC